MRVTAEEISAVELGEVQEGETILGDASDETKRLYVLKQKTEKRIDSAYKEMMKDFTPALLHGNLAKFISEKKSVIEFLKKQKSYLKTITAVMWESAKVGIEEKCDGTSGKCSEVIGLRKDWKIISKECDGCEGFGIEIGVIEISNFM